MKRNIKIVSIILILALLCMLSGCEEKKVTPISEQEFIDFLEQKMNMKNGKDFHEVEDYAIETYNGEEAGPTEDWAYVHAIEAQQGDVILVYCMFDTREEAEASFQVAVQKYEQFKDSKKDRCVYTPGETGYVQKQLSNVWDSWYYFDQTVIYTCCVGDQGRKTINRFLNEFSYPTLK